MSSFDRYEIHQEIASGGMARVHLGRLRGDQGFQRVVAVKMMHPKLSRDPKFVAMFRDEALLASRIRHPNVVPTLDVVSDGDKVVIVMEYVRGLPLSVLLTRSVRAGEEVPAPIAVAILAGMLSGLHAAHEARSADGAPLSIVHRDVSPTNVLVDADGVARVMDFGIAKASSQLHVTMEGEIKGKLAFMAPEQILSKPVDRRADVFAAGVVAYSMMIGMPLFAKGEVDQVREQVLSMPIPPLCDRRPDVGRALSDAIAKALERDRGARFASARDFAIAVESAFDKPASARQLGAWVERLGADVLAEHDRMIARIESSEGTEPEPGSEAPLEITSTDAPTVELVGREPPKAPPPAESATRPPIGTLEETPSGATPAESAVAPPRKQVSLVPLAAFTLFAFIFALGLFVAKRSGAPTQDAGASPASSSSPPGVAASSPERPLEPSSDPAARPSLSAADEPALSSAPTESSNVSGSSVVASARPSGNRGPIIQKPPGYFPNRP